MNLTHSELIEDNILDTNEIIYKLKIFFRNAFSPSFWKRKIRFFLQRLSRGFDDSDTWWLSGTIAKFVLPRLRHLRAYHAGYPASLRNSIEWKRIMDKMVIALEAVEIKNDFDMSEVILRWERLKKLVKENKHEFNFLPEDEAVRDEVLKKIIIGFEAIIRDDWEETSNKEIEEGLDLFRKYFESLWD